MSEPVRLYMAKQWGRKAAAEGLTAASNPYRDYAARMAWLRGLGESNGSVSA